MRKAGKAGQGEGVVAEEKHKKTVHHGKCLCGDVRFTAYNLSDIWYCHCKQCQHLTGYYIAAAGCKREDLIIEGEVNWLAISELSRSGHCYSCGSYLFWDDASRDSMSITAGNIQGADEIEVKGHIFVEEKGAYYQITDGLPQYVGFPPQGTR